MARLTEQQKEQIRQLREGGMSCLDIAAEIGCSRKTVNNTLDPDSAARRKAQRDALGDELRVRQRAYYETNKTAVLAKNSAWRARNLDKCREQQRSYYAGNKEARNQATREWKAANPGYTAEHARAYAGRRSENENKRRLEDPQFAIVGRMRARIRCAMKQQRAGKSANGENLLGVTIGEWIATQPAEIVEAMMNGEAVHVDEIRPCSSFDLTDPDQQAVCFNWRNRQLLLAADNLSKGANWDRPEWEAMMAAKGYVGNLF